MTTEVESVNERVALLLGWERGTLEGTWIAPLTGRSTSVTMQMRPPDYTQWDRFEEMQEYVRGLQTDQMSAVELAVINALSMNGAGSYWQDFGLWTVTPTILRDAIDEVCGEEA